MKTSKIKSIQNNGTWKDLFKFEVEMENGDVGGCFAASQEPPFKVGDEKQYDYTQNGRYWNIKFAKEQKPAWNGGGGKSFVKEDKSADIARAVALKAAVRSAWDLSKFVTTKNNHNDTIGRIQRDTIQQWVNS